MVNSTHLDYNRVVNQKMQYPINIEGLWYTKKYQTTHLFRK